MNEAKLGWGGARKGAGAKPAGYVPPPERIEYEGWSRQAPEGMVRRHISQWQRIVSTKAQALGR